MSESGNPGLVEEVAAALAWWREAGVDACFLDDPVDWLAEKQARADTHPHPGASREPHLSSSPGAAERVPRPGGAAPRPAAAAPVIDPAAIPRDLRGFTEWWLSEPLLDEGRTSGRLPPRGEAGAEIMILVSEPELEDSERLLSGPQGRLLEGMLAAMGVSPERTYVASALPRHTPMADWQGITAKGYGEVLRRHVALVAPRRLIAFGSNVPPLLGNDPPNLGQFFTQFNHEGMDVPFWTAADLGVLLARPRAKARVWQQWLDLGLDWAPDFMGPDRMGS